jgi:cation diffusion facilitator CzcD-associated flavoprotein CzcO
MANCSDCNQPIPKYAGVPAGFVKPTPARSNREKQTREEKQQLDFSQSEPGKTDVIAIEAAVCKECYLKEFARVYPGAQLPRLPAPVDPIECERAEQAERDLQAAQIRAIQRDAKASAEAEADRRRRLEAAIDATDDETVKEALLAALDS